MTATEHGTQAARPPPSIRLFSSDLDGTLLGNPEAARRFAEHWASLEAARRPLLVYNTERSIADTQSLVHARQLPEPEFIIGSVGTELHDSLYNRGAEFRHQFAEGWDLSVVDEIVARASGIRRQPRDHRHAFKSSWYWERATREQVEAVRGQLREAGVQATVIYSCRYFLDVVPARAGKGKALAWLCRRLCIALPRVLVAGDTANDASMFRLPGVKGIVVENALPELLAETCERDTFLARASMADGVIEGLMHYGIAPARVAGPTT